MFRKATIVLVLAGSFLAAQVTGLPKPARKLNTKSPTKAGPHNKGVASKAKTVELCFQRVFPDGGPLFVDSFMAIFGASVYKCADMKSDGTGLVGAPTAIGIVGINCAGSADPANLALCNTQLTLGTEWHKTSPTSSLVGSFWAESAKLAVLPATDAILTMLNPVVTGATGAWGKVDNIQTVSLAQIGTSKVYYKLTITYKGRGWNPAACSSC